MKQLNFPVRPASRQALFCVGLFLLFSIFYCRFVLPETPVWITDNGSKYMILHNFAETGKVQFDHPFPALFPCGGFHFLKTPQGISPFHSPLLPQITLPWYRLFGDFGAHFWPWAGACVLLLLLAKYGRDKWAAPLALCATPLLFYSQLFWEMVPAAAFASAGLFLLFDRRPVWGGFLLGAGLWMREELYVVGIAAAIVLMLERDWKNLLRAALGAFLPVAALWMRNFYCDGSILGIHGAMYHLNNRPQGAAGLLNFFRETGVNFYQHLFRFSCRPNGIIGAVVSAGLIAAGWVKQPRIKGFAGIVFAAVMAVLTAALFFHPSPLYLSAQTAGLIPSLPLCAGFYLFSDKLLFAAKRGIRLLSRTCALVIVLIPFLLSPHDVGLTWGARHYCVIMPVLTTLSLYAFKKTGWLKGIAALLPGSLLVISLVMQFYAMRAQVRVTRETAAFDEALCAMPEKVIVTDAFFLPEETPRAFSEKLILEIATPEQAATVSALLAKGTDFALVFAPAFRRLPPETMKRLLQKVQIPAPPRRFQIGGAMEIYLFQCRTTPPVNAK